MERVLEAVTSINSAINTVVWGPVMLALLVGTGALPDLASTFAALLVSQGLSAAFVALYAVYLAVCAGLTALTVHLVREYFGSAGSVPASPLKVERAKMDWRKWVPVGLMVLVSILTYLFFKWKKLL